VKIAALCHDLGHGPFSHVFDTHVVREAAETLGREGQVARANQLRKHTHEAHSVDMFKQMCTEMPASTRIDAQDRRFIEELILGDKLAGGLCARRGRSASKWYLYDIVSNTDSGLDVDKLDYLMRDPHVALGDSGHGGFALPPLLNSVSVRLADFDKGSGGGAPAQFDRYLKSPTLERRPVLAFAQKCAPAVLEVFKSRNYLHTHLYTHKVVVGYDLLVTDVLTTADQLRLPIVNGKRLVEAVLDPKAFVKLNDSVIDLCAHELQRAEACGEVQDEDAMRRLQLLLHRWQTHKHYTCLGEWALLERERELSLREQRGLCKAFSEGIAGESRSISASDLHVELRHVHCGQKDRNPLDSVRFYAKADTSACVATQVDAKEACGESNVPSSFESKKFRCFWKGGGEGVAAARDALHAWLEETGRRINSKRQTSEVQLAASEDEDRLALSQEPL